MNATVIAMLILGALFIQGGTILTGWWFARKIDKIHEAILDQAQMVAEFEYLGTIELCRARMGERATPADVAQQVAAKVSPQAAKVLHDRLGADFSSWLARTIDERRR